MGRFLILMGLCFSLDSLFHLLERKLKRNKNQQIFAYKDLSDDVLRQRFQVPVITFWNLPGGDIKKSNQSENTSRSHDGECQPKHLNCSILESRPSPPSFRPNNQYIAASIRIGSNGSAACLWWAAVNSDSLWVTELRQNPNSLLTLLCCAGLAGLWYFLEAYPKQARSNKGLIGWRLIRKTFSVIALIIRRRH